MTDNNHGKSINLAAQMVIVGSMFALPLVFYPGGAEPFTLPKIVFLSVLVLAAILLLSVKFTRQEKERLPAGGRLDLFVILFLLTAAASAAYALHRPSAFFGHYSRHDGLVSYTVFAGLFFVGRTISWNHISLRRLFSATLASATILSAIGIAEYLGINLSTIESPSSRIMATTGNPVWLAGFLAVGFSIATAWALVERGGKRILLVAASGLFFVVIALSASRSGMLAALVGGLTAAALSHRFKKAIMLGTGILIGLLALLAILAQPAGIGGVLPQSAVVEALSPANVKLAVVLRSDTARSAVEMIKDRPLLGVGPSNFPWVYQQLQSRTAVAWRGTAFRADDAHNYWLQIGASLGLPALIILIMIVYTVFTGSRMSVAREPFLALIPPAVAALAVVVSFEPMDISLAAVFWLLAGVTASRMPVWRANSRAKWILPAVHCLLIPALGISVFFNLRMLAADAHYKTGLELKRSGAAEAALFGIEEAARLASHVDRYSLSLGDLMSERGRLSADRDLIGAGIDHYREAAEKNPWDAENWIKLSQAYENAERTTKQEYGFKAEENATRALELAPASPRAHRALGAALLARKGTSKVALDHLKRAVALDRNYAQGWFWLGLAHEGAADWAAAENAFRRAQSDLTVRPDAVQALARIQKKAE